MIRNYLTVTFRNFFRHKEYTFINIFGLAVSLTCCVLLMMFVRSEWSYDNFHSKADRLYRVWQREIYGGKTADNVFTPFPLAPALQTTFPEVASSCRVLAINPIVKPSSVSSFTEAVDIVDSTFFRMFDFPILSGHSSDLFSIDQATFITPSTAKKYFGSADPIGKNITMVLNMDTVLFTVRGIVAEAPEASSIKYHVLIPFPNARRLFKPRAFTNWFSIFTETYVLLKPGTAATTLEKKLPSMMRRQLGSAFGSEDFTMHLQPMKSIHLDASLPAGNKPISDPKYAYVLATIGALILIVACINFVTLSLGQSTRRALEVGVRKTLGAARGQLLTQFLGESSLLVILSVFLGLALARALVQPFDALIGRSLTLPFDPFLALFLLCLILLIALISGIYPALILSAFKPMDVLKGRVTLKGSSRDLLRKGLVVGQFTASIAMIIGTFVIGQQMHYLQTKDLGYHKDQVVVVESDKPFASGFRLAALYQAELIKHPLVSQSSISTYSFAQTPWIQLDYEDLQKQVHVFSYNTVDPSFVPVMGISIASGRNFVFGNSADLASGVLVNETFVRAFHLVDPVGKKLPGPFPVHIIGVMKDFHFESLHTPITPLVLSANPDSVVNYANDENFSSPPQPRISIRLPAGSLSTGLSALRLAWNSVAPGQDFDYHFLDEQVAAQYAADQRTSVLVRLASSVSIFIACMGLFGLATLAVMRRVREIGIRKVLGASVPSVVRLLALDFVWLVVIAALIASPLAGWAVHIWLQDFSYRIDVHWWVFLLAGLSALVVALATISFKTIRAAMASPVGSLWAE